MSLKKFPFIQQLDRMDCGPVCLQMVSKFYGKEYGISFLREICDLGKDGSSLLGIKNGAQAIGLSAYGLNVTISNIFEQILLPIILHWNQEHFVVLYKIKKKKNSYKFYISDPAKGKYTLEKERFMELWLGNKTSSDTDLGLGLLLNVTDDFTCRIPSEFQQKTSSGFSTIIKEALIYKKDYCQVFVGVAISLGLQAIIPFISKSIFDFGIANNSFNLVILFISSQIVFNIFNIIVSFFRNWTTLFIGSRINISIISNHLSKLLRLHFSYFDRKNSGDIIQRINDNSRIEDFLTSNLVSVIISLTTVCVFEIVLASFNIRLFFFFNVIILIYFFWTKFLLLKIKDIDYQRFDYASRNQSFVIQLINGIQDIKLSNSISKRIIEWKQLREDLFEYNQKYIILKQIQDFGAFFLLNLSSMIVVGYSANCVINHTMTIGEMVAIQYILAQITSPIENIVQSSKSLNDAKVSIDRLNEIDDYPIEKLDDQRAKIMDLNNDIVFKNVCFSYPGSNGRRSIENINVRILHGKTNAIVGASGSGKTTVAKLLLKMYEPESGSIYLGESNFVNVSFDEWRSITSSVMQDGYIFSDSIINNIVLDGGQIDKLRLSNAIEIANIKDFINQSPLGLQTKIGMDGIGLSQGQKQRLLIARCVYKDPQLIIFDEATNALDSVNENIIYNNLQKFFTGKTVVTIAHRLSTIKNADQIMVFDNGKIVESGTHLNLIEQHGYYYKLIYNQHFDNVVS